MFVLLKTFFGFEIKYSGCISLLFNTLLKGLIVIFGSRISGTTECKLLNNWMFLVVEIWLFELDKHLLRFLFKLLL